VLAVRQVEGEGGKVHHVEIIVLVLIVELCALVVVVLFELGGI